MAVVSGQGRKMELSDGRTVSVLQDEKKFWTLITQYEFT